MFSRTAEYALRAVVFLATRPEELCGSELIAQKTRVPVSYLSKILKDLVDAGIISSRRGPSGGFTLARGPGSVTVLEVVNAADPIERILTCPLGIPSHGTRLCRLHRKLDSAIALVEKALASSTIAEMIEPSEAAACVFPTVGGRPAKRAGR